METNLVKSSYASITQLPIALVKNSSGSEQNLSLEKLASLLIQFITQLKKTEPSLNMMNAYRGYLSKPQSGALFKKHCLISYTNLIL